MTATFTQPLPCGGYYCDVDDGHVIHRDCDLAPGKPAVYHLAADPIARDILRHLVRQPWQELHWMALRDRAEELALDPRHLDAWRSLHVMNLICLARDESCSRRQRQRLIRVLRLELQQAFGDSSEPPF